MKHLRYVTALLAAAFTVVAASAQDARLDRGARMAGRGIGVDKAVVTRHGGLYRSKQKIIVRLSFDERERAIRDRIISEAAEIVACSQW